MIPESIQLELLRGRDINIDSIITIKQYTMNEIMDDISFDKYNRCANYLAYNPYDYRVELFESNKLYTEITHWELFLTFFMNPPVDFVDSVKLLLSIDISKYNIVENNNRIELINKENNHIIDEIKFNFITLITREIFGLEQKIPKFANRTAIEYEINRHKRRLSRKRNHNNVTLKSIISALAWSDNPIKLNEIWELTQYQIFDGLKSSNKKDRWNNIMLGIYTGNIKQDSINLNKEQWFNNK